MAPSTPPRCAPAPPPKRFLATSMMIITLYLVIDRLTYDLNWNRGWMDVRLTVKHRFKIFSLMLRVSSNIFFKWIMRSYVDSNTPYCVWEKRSDRLNQWRSQEFFRGRHKTGKKKFLDLRPIIFQKSTKFPFLLNRWPFLLSISKTSKLTFLGGKNRKCST